MKVSYNWLNEYFSGMAPASEKVEKLLTMHSMEVEESEKIGNDIVLNVKTLPNNNHSCLCHRGIAREIGTIANIKPNLYSREFKLISVSKTSKNLSVKIDLPAQAGGGKLCRRYIGRVIENIKVDSSPAWLKEKLEVLGQRSINNIVDATNFVMLEIGQPMHAFDADKMRNIRGQDAENNAVEIVVRNAKKGEKIVTLDKKEVDLDENVLLITDGANPLAIAGIKGGNFAELEINTKNIILESANFDPILVRKTAQKIKIQTDASKRYENDLTPELSGEAMDILSSLIVEIAGTKDTKVGEVIDTYPNRAEKIKLGISSNEASSIIGVEMKDSDIEDIFNRFGFEWVKDGESFVITVPAERLDLRIKEDLAEEIGRIYGYEKIKDISVPQIIEKPRIDKGFALKEKIRRILYQEGFSEVINYSFTSKGEIELSNPMSPERKFLRMNLTDGIKDSLEFNARYSELVEMPQVKIFEFGHIFKNSGEESNFVIGVKNPVGLKKPKENEILENILKQLSEKLDIDFSKIKNSTKEQNIAEFDFEEILDRSPEITSYDFSEIGDKNKKYKKISQFPFMIRDIAVFTPEGTKADELFSIIQKEAGELMVKNKLFDVFTKTLSDGKIMTSYAYRLVFQSYDKTLTDEEVNRIMAKITEKMNANTGWQVR
jgi:phenylalanyl-tRNA synthetase beta chain